MFRTATTFTRTRISTPGSSDPGESGSMNVILPTTTFLTVDAISAWRPDADCDTTIAQRIWLFGTEVGPPDIDRYDGAADHTALQAAADDFDLGQLGHGVARSVSRGPRAGCAKPRRRPPARLPSCSDRSPSRGPVRRRAPRR